jgi:hypothetical protein
MQINQSGHLLLCWRFCRAVTYNGRIIVYGGAVQDGTGTKERLGDVYSLIVQGCQLCWSECDRPAAAKDMPRSE